MSEYRYCPLCGLPLKTGLVDGKERKACGAECGYVQWDNPVPVVAGIVVYRERVIIARNSGWPEKMFGLITGFLEKGETPEDGICREVKEELGLESSIRELVGLYPFDKMNQLLIVYCVDASGTVLLGEELAEIRELEPAKLRPWPFGTGPALRDWLIKEGHLKE